MVKIEIPYPLRSYTEGKAEVEVTCSSVRQALQLLTEQFPRIAPHLFGDDNQLRKFMLVYLNDEDIRYIGGLEAPIDPGSVLKIIPSVAGGKAQI